MIGFGNEPNLVFALTFRQFCRKVSARRRHGGLGRVPASAFVIQMLCLRQRRHRRRWYLKGADNTPYEKIGDEVRSLADEVPFDIPDSWEWVRLGSIVYNRGQITPSTDFCYIDIGSIDNKNQKLNPTDTVIAPDKAPSRARKLVDKGDVLYSTVRPYLHNMCIVDRDFSCIPIASTGFAVLTCHAELCNKFLFYYMMSPDFDAYANNTDNAKGVAYPAINDDRLYKALIPIPPLGEQFRIVSAIESVDASIRDYGVKEEALRALNGSFPESLKKSILQEAVRVSWYRKTHLTSLQRLCWSVSGWKSSGSSKRAKSKRTSTNPSFSDGIILIMKSVVQKRSASTRRYHLKSLITGLGRDFRHLAFSVVVKRRQCRTRSFGMVAYRG